MPWYHQPYEAAEDGTWPRVRTGMWVGLAVTLIVGLVVLPPHALPPADHFATALLFGGITLVVSGALAFLLPPARTVGRQLLNIAVNFFCIGLANYCAMGVLDNVAWSWANALRFQAITLGVGAFPVAVLTLFGYNRQLRRRLREAEQLNAQTHPPGTGSAPTERRSIRFPSGFGVDPATLLAVEADKNYVRVYYRGAPERFAVQQERMTLTAATALLDEAPQLLRVHRAFIVHLGAVTRVAGNAQGFRLRVPPLDFEVPVSRSYVPVFRRAYAAVRG